MPESGSAEVRNPSVPQGGVASMAGIYEYVGIDWTTGQTKARWVFPDDSRKWNACGGITSILEHGDMIVGGAFAIKRLNIGDGQ
ncbi:hypothetical protein [Afipia broomeae]|uniref:Uncharacterized protein n=1 Tax=Afipia broomeae ATCC 49717 TaxID=883078 RepID=K8PI05_9BRAD|nr:hypothetical protein [Afipia broomeae]EKS42252.1 hypothetical protein HMPREF9695_01344 [Afipia broomeae ATCC 49717]